MSDKLKKGWAEPTQATHDWCIEACKRFIIDDVTKEYLVEDKFKVEDKPTCRGSYLLGSACGKCEGCENELNALVDRKAASEKIGKYKELKDFIQKRHDRLVNDLDGKRPGDDDYNHPDYIHIRGELYDLSVIFGEIERIEKGD